jgi:hypothetical protein
MALTASPTIVAQECTCILYVRIFSWFHNPTDRRSLFDSFSAGLLEWLVHFSRSRINSLQAAPHVLTACATPTACRSAFIASDVASSGTLSWFSAVRTRWMFCRSEATSATFSLAVARLLMRPCSWVMLFMAKLVIPNAPAAMPKGSMMTRRMKVTKVGGFGEFHSE